MKKRYRGPLAGIIIIFVALIAYFSVDSSSKKTQGWEQVREGDFQIQVEVTGEIKSEKSEDIVVPEIMKKQELRVHYLRITDLIPEGTLVKKGDYVATLDQTLVAQRLKENSDELIRIENNLRDAKLDSSLALSKARDLILEARQDVAEKKINMELSKYDSPAEQRKAEISYERASRNFKIKKRNYQKGIRRQTVHVERREHEFEYYQERQSLFEELRKALRVTAPKEGMLVYAKSWDGSKVGVGKNVTIWEPQIATLPDLSLLISQAYVSEIDISKVYKGQEVVVQVDAFPGKDFKGTIDQISSIGKEINGSDNKMFELLVKLETGGVNLRPGMTTTNNVLIKSYNKVLFVPLWCVFGDETAPYVYKKDGFSIVKQEVKLGEENEDYVIILNGVAKEEKLLMEEPENKDELELLKLT